MDEAAYRMIQYIEYDTVTYDPDSLYTWIENMHSFEGDLWLAREYMADGEEVIAQ
jgi:hypothetical protein